ncbi:uncharacterized protein LOC125531897, partial [Triticum urartu]|uniref:uncharacterized protein LOC125531897 n=1 Tax=Triticum urartu TaxID=4572 RepID=UPI002043F567
YTILNQITRRSKKNSKPNHTASSRAIGSELSSWFLRHGVNTANHTGVHCTTRIRRPRSRPLLCARRRGPRLRVLGYAASGSDAVWRRRRRSSRLLPCIVSTVPACLRRGCSPHGRPRGGDTATRSCNCWAILPLLDVVVAVVATNITGLLSTITSKAKPVELMTTAMHKDWPSPQKFIGHDDQQGEQGGAHHHRPAQGNVKPAKSQ